MIGVGEGATFDVALRLLRSTLVENDVLEFVAVVVADVVATWLCFSALEREEKPS